MGGKAIGFLDVMVDLKPGKRSSRPTLQKEIEGSLLFVYHFCQNPFDNLKLFTSSEFVENINHVEIICKNNSNLGMFPVVKIL